MALTWENTTVLNISWNPDQKIALTWSTPVNNGSPAFQEYSIWISSISQANANGRTGDAFEINSNDHISLATRNTLSVVIDDPGIVFLSNSIIFVAVFGYDGSSYSGHLTPRGHESSNQFKCGMEITSVAQLTVATDTGEIGDIEVDFIVSTGFAINNNIWLEYKDPDGFWYSCTKIIGGTNVNLTSITENVSYNLYWSEPSFDIDFVDIDDLELRMVLWSYS